MILADGLGLELNDLVEGLPVPKSENRRRGRLTSRSVDAAQLAVIPCGPPDLGELEPDALGGLRLDSFARLAWHLRRRLRVARHRVAQQDRFTRG